MRWRESGLLKEAASRVFADTGFYILRGGWAADDLCLFFDGASLGAGHQHEDKLSIDVSGYGQHFLVDPGCHSYIQNRWRSYLNSSWSHGEHAIESLLQFAPAPVLVDQAAAAFRTVGAGLPTIEVICLPGGPRPELSLLPRPDRSPPRGWLSHGAGKPVASPMQGYLQWQETFGRVLMSASAARLS